jgi:DNA processing protein
MDRVELLALCRIKGVSWNFIAREAQRPGGLERLLRCQASEQGPEAERSLALLKDAAAHTENYRETIGSLITETQREGFGLTTVLDEDYPINLRSIYNLPPFLFYLGELRPDDAYSVAVVGTREPSAEGITRAHKMADLLSKAGVTVLSGLARGIDTAAHEACLAAGGRTIAVLGSGIRRVYPEENADLADRIAKSGALVSQFWPDTAPTSYNFPRRNVVTSGMGQGTVVIEASATSGAKMQARLAIEHGKQVFLLKSLVTEREWARRYLKRPRVREVTNVEDIITALRSTTELAQRADENRAQLALALG